LKKVFLLLTISLLINCNYSFSQKMKWATKVLGFSSQFSIPNQATEYSASQVLGIPSKLPAFGTSKCAWQPAVNDNINDDWITVSFDTLMKVRQIVVAENIGQGCITHIYGFDEKGEEHLIFSENKNPSKDIGRLLLVNLDKPTPFLLKELKLVLNTARVKGINQIDAIGVSADEEPFEARINTTETAIKGIKKENLGKYVNSKTHDVAPVISPDGKNIYFTRWDHPDNFGKDKKQDIWNSTFADGVWQPAVNLTKPINNEDNNAACSISGDGRTLFLINVYNADGTMEKGMSVAKQTGKGWSFPMQMKIKNYVNYSPYTEFAIGGNGKVLIMTAHRRDTRGAKDLYVSFLQADSVWSEPKTMGNVINTAEDEFTPFLASDNKSLYFSTKGHAGYGENDIFVSRRLDDSWTKWSAPINLGPTINSEGWDGYFTIPASGDFAYLCSQNESYGLEDIFRIKLPEETKPDPVAIVSGTVLNSSTNLPVSAMVFANAIGEKSDSLKVEYSPQTGDYKLILPLKKKFVIYAKQSGFLSINESVDLLKETKYREIKRNIYLMPIEAGQKAQLKEVVFQQSSYELLPASFQELDKMVEMMNENKAIEIHLDGHTDNQGDFNQNIKLSENRVNEVKKYIVSKGIAANRISTKAWGGSKAIFSNESEATRMKNRRVEFTIKKK
jgi:outer membrane protein OmpA-like peptidoglycan-associated protein